MTDKTGYIYKITDDICYYIGSTTRSIKNRFWEHSSKKKTVLPCYKYFKDNNWNNVRIDIIDTIAFINKEDLLKKENEYIKLSDTSCLNKRKAYESKEEFNLRHNIAAKKRKECKCGKFISSGHFARHKKVCAYKDELL